MRAYKKIPVNQIIVLLYTIIPIQAAKKKEKNKKIIELIPILVYFCTLYCNFGRATINPENQAMQYIV